MTQHQIALLGVKCRAWLRNIKDSDFPSLLMQHILLYRNIAISYFNIDIRIVGKNIAVHRCIGVSLQPYKLHQKTLRITLLLSILVVSGVGAHVSENIAPVSVVETVSPVPQDTPPGHQLAVPPLQTRPCLSLQEKEFRAQQGHLYQKSVLSNTRKEEMTSFQHEQSKS